MFSYLCKIRAMVAWRLEKCEMKQEVQHYELKRDHVLEGIHDDRISSLGTMVGF